MPFSSVILSLVTFHSFYVKAWQLRVSTVSWCSKDRQSRDLQWLWPGRRKGREGIISSRQHRPAGQETPTSQIAGKKDGDKTSLAAKCPVHYRDRGFLWEAVIMLLLNYQINGRNSKLITILQVRLLVGDKENQP